MIRVESPRPSPRATSAAQMTSLETASSRRAGRRGPLPRVGGPGVQGRLSQGGCRHCQHPLATPLVHAGRHRPPAAPLGTLAATPPPETCPPGPGGVRYRRRRNQQMPCADPARGWRTVVGTGASAVRDRKAGPTPHRGDSMNMQCIAPEPQEVARNIPLANKTYPLGPKRSMALAGNNLARAMCARLTLTKHPDRGSGGCESTRGRWPRAHSGSSCYAATQTTSG